MGRNMQTGARFKTGSRYLSATVHARAKQAESAAHTFVVGDTVQVIKKPNIVRKIVEIKPGREYCLEGIAGQYSASQLKLVKK